MFGEHAFSLGDKQLCIIIEVVECTHIITAIPVIDRHEIVWNVPSYMNPCSDYVSI